MLPRLFRPILTLCLLLFIFVSPALAANGLVAAPETCLECHGDVVSAKDFAGSVHGQNGCTSCHVEASNLEAHEEGKIIPGKVDCTRCHKNVACSVHHQRAL